MSKPNTESLTSGYYWSFGATALPLVSAFVCSLIIARTMGPEVVGLVNWTMATATVLLIVAKFGVDGASSRLLSEYQISNSMLLPRVIKDSVKLRLIFTLPVALFTYLISSKLSSFFNEQSLEPLFKLASLLIVAVSFNELSALMVLGLKKFRLLFQMRLWMLVLRVALVSLSALLALSARGVIVSYIFASAIPAAVIILHLLRTNKSNEAPISSSYSFNRLLKLSAFLAVSGASVTIYSLLDKLMLGYFEGAKSVGIYSMARNLVETSLFPTFALIMTLRPAMAGAYTSGDVGRCSYLVTRSIRSSIVYASFVIVVFFLLSEQIVTGLFGERFIGSAHLLVLFLPLILMRGIGTVILPGLIAADRAHIYALLTLMGAILNFSFNMAFIPRWGADGAVIATLSSYLPMEVVGLVALARTIPSFWKLKETVLIVSVTGISSLLIFLYEKLVPEPDGLIMTIIYSVVIVFILFSLYMLLRLVSREEAVSMIRPLMSRGIDERKV